ncbi:hypothetical protein BJ742DRAFT_766028 [Cladochytrium replicatum]|nr:hypothetical protein BJ742DRAFT_766028 [Cladochytrium replicatum]
MGNHGILIPILVAVLIVSATVFIWFFRKIEKQLWFHRVLDSTNKVKILLAVPTSEVQYVIQLQKLLLEKVSQLRLGADIGTLSEESFQIYRSESDAVALATDDHLWSFADFGSRERPIVVRVVLHLPRLRVSGKNKAGEHKEHQLNVDPSVTFHELRKCIASEFGLDPWRTVVKYHNPPAQKIYVCGEDTDILEKIRLAYPFSMPIVDNGHADVDKIDVTSLNDCLKEVTCEFHNATKHNFFLSYRVATEATVVQSIAFALSSHTAFWDQLCLNKAQKWVHNFVFALHHSKVVVLFMSEKGLERVTKAHEIADNMFLEWELAVDLHLKNEIVLFPVAVGANVTATVSGKTDSETLFKRYSRFTASEFPDSMHACPLSPHKRKVRKTMEMIFEVQTHSLNPSEPAQISSLVTALLGKLKRVDNLGEIMHELSISEVRSLLEWLAPHETLVADMVETQQARFKEYLDGTRTWLLDTVNTFLFPDTESATHKRLLWLDGSAGVGKSVMASLIINDLTAKNQLDAYFYCKHDDTRRTNAKSMVATIALQLCYWNPRFGRHLLDAMRANSIAQKNLSVMFEVLIENPLKQLGQLDKPVVIVVDALDECGMLHRRHDVLQLFSSYCGRLPSYVRMVITSRPEDDIVTAFHIIPKEKLDPTAKQNKQDALLYIKHFLARHTTDSDALTKGPDALVDSSAGLFVWLVMACKVLENLPSITLDAIHKLDASTDSNDRKMDTMYNRTFRRIFNEGLHQNLHCVLAPVLRRVLAAIVFAQENLTAADIAALLQMDIATVEFCVRQLMSVLHVDSNWKIQVFHKSEEMYQRRDMLPPNVLAMKIDKGIPPHRLYAAVYLHVHLRSLDEVKFGLRDLVQSFVLQHLLHWFEMLSAIERLDVVIPTCNQLLTVYQTNLEDQHSATCTNLLQDAIRLLRRFNPALSQGIMHVYWTAVPLAPKNRPIASHFMDKPSFSSDLPRPRPLAGADDQWPTLLSTLEAHGSSVKSVAWSRDGTMVASASYDKTVKLWDGATGTEQHTLRGHDKVVNVIAWSANSSKLASGSSDTTVKLWDTAKDRPVLGSLGSGPGPYTKCTRPECPVFMENFRVGFGSGIGSSRKTLLGSKIRPE